MAKVAVIHSAFEDTPRTVALVEVGNVKGNQALEYAYFRTQNIEGSWSRGPRFTVDGVTVDNPDYSKDTLLMAELETHNGKTLGIRSTCVGDYLLLGTTRYRVGICGFEATGSIERNKQVDSVAL